MSACSRGHLPACAYFFLPQINVLEQQREAGFWLPPPAVRPCRHAKQSLSTAIPIVARSSFISFCPVLRIRILTGFDVVCCCTRASGITPARWRGNLLNYRPGDARCEVPWKDIGWTETQDRSSQFGVASVFTSWWNSQGVCTYHSRLITQFIIAINICHVERADASPATDSGFINQTKNSWTTWFSEHFIIKQTIRVIFFIFNIVLYFTHNNWSILENCSFIWSCVTYEDNVFNNICEFTFSIHLTAQKFIISTNAQFSAWLTHSHISTERTRIYTYYIIQ